ncbi:MerR family transcriptional regulator [Nocardia sp. NPDC005366]|uniref:MerR family transcriptional regulator n=1 Tax=Nocardia sp. NPDC005366 TaxID=3156878 RepID=UPI0033A8DE00
MRIGELARRAATTTRALRYYESRGLLTAHRDDSGYRIYGEEDLRILRQIRTLQDCGFDLEEIRPFVECLRAGYPTGDSCPASSEVYRRKLTELDDRIARLHDVREWIRTRLDEPEDIGQRLPVAPKCELTPSGLRLGA